MAHDRRSYLGLLAGALTAGTAGCLAGSNSIPPGESETTATPTPSPTDGESTTGSQTPDSSTDSTDATSSTPDSGTLVLEQEDPAETDSLTVFPSNLRDLLRQAAQTDGPVRTRCETHVYAPQSVLPAFETVELDAPDGDVNGVYEVTVDSGIHYRMIVTAEQADPPDDVTVTPVADLPEEREELVLAAIGDERERVQPETELGEWVRETFFGGYFEHEGTTYLGKEQQQTDAAFFSTRAWYILSLDRTDETADDADITLRLRDVDSDVRSLVDNLLDDRTKDQTRIESQFHGYTDAIEQFVAKTDGILTHVDTFSVAIER